MALSLSGPRAAVQHNIELADGTSLDWDDLYADLGPALESYARSRGVRDPEDLVQDVFASFYRRSGDFTGDMSGLRSLLFTIAYRRIADVHRHSARRPEVLVAGPRAATSGSWDGPEVEEAVISTETVSAAMDALSALTERERAVITMRIFEEASPDEVSRRLGLSNVNVRVIQARAFRKVRAVLEAKGHLRDPVAVLMSLGSLRHVTSRLPAKGPLGQWVDEVRAAGVTSRNPFEGPTHLSLHGSGLGTQAVEIWSQTAMRTAVVVSALALGAAVVIPGWAPSAAQGDEGGADRPDASARVMPDWGMSGGADGSEHSSDPGAVAAGEPTDVPFPLPPWSSQHVGLIAPTNGVLSLPMAEVDLSVLRVVSTLAEQVTTSLLRITEATLADVSGEMSELFETAPDTAGAVVEGAGETAAATSEEKASIANEIIEATQGVGTSPLVDSVAGPVEEGSDELVAPVEDVTGSVDGLVAEVEPVSEDPVDDLGDDGLGGLD